MTDYIPPWQYTLLIAGAFVAICLWAWEMNRRRGG